MAVEGADLSGTRTLPRTYIDFDDMDNLGPVIRQDRAMVGYLAVGAVALAVASAVVVLAIWAGEPPYNLRGKYWSVVSERHFLPKVPA